MPFLLFIGLLLVGVDGSSFNGTLLPIAAPLGDATDWPEPRFFVRTGAMVCLLMLFSTMQRVLKHNRGSTECWVVMPKHLARCEWSGH